MTKKIIIKQIDVLSTIKFWTKINSKERTCTFVVGTECGWSGN